ncbi:hypothetical protein G7Z17_g1691 [Cylindrodendrum hubeiense]|uniref:Uncharacterized protein n=1 Tax=Cylindrodendrum hubeiense TaxID=595255 RepID=A0A9P5LF35_9HYPO|nr:hypothetical protein G7Z17_g1691 [Cylindrodendrum hubeiense]
MQSHSRNHFHPALSNRVPDRALTSSIAADQQLSPDQVRLWSFQEPPLAPGDYSLSVSQQIQLPAPGDNEDKRPPLKSLSIPNTQLHVSGPKFKFSDLADLHSVYPAAGHSAFARTLAHAVFNHPTTPWEQHAKDGNQFGFNKLPWVGVLSFTEEELVSDPAVYRGLGFKDDEVSAEYGSVSLKAVRLAELQSVVKSAPTAPGAGTNFKPNDDVSMVLLKPKLFKEIFTSYDANNNRVWSGNADLSRFAMMAHVEESHGGFTARSHVDDVPTEQPQHSIVVSPRTGRPGIVSPTRVISHIFSLEDVEKIVLTNNDSTTQYVGLVSLHSWDWMSVPEGAVDFQHVMANLGKTVQPLRIKYEKEEQEQSLANQPAQEADRSPSQEAIGWLKAKFDAGYVFKPQTAISGVKTESLIRGPLIPVKPERKTTMSSSLSGEGLALADDETGISNVSHQSAWTLGRSMVMADRTLTAALLRLRGCIHAEAVRRAKGEALTGKGYGILSSHDTYLSHLEDAMEQLKHAQSVTGLNSRDNATARWARTEDERADLPVMRLSIDTSFTLTEYIDHVDAVTLDMFGFKAQDSPDQPPAASTIDSDAAAIRAWVVDRFMLAGVPLHYLVLHPNMLPQESIRTFCVDQDWINRLVDGGLSLANHFARDDDAIRRAIKTCIQKYLETPIGNNPQSTTPQLPRWGFFLRSMAVSAFPDLKVEAPLPSDAPANAREVVFMQVLADDILICLFDRLPGEKELERIRISQPHHQQGFALGTRLLAAELDGMHRGVPIHPTQDNITVAELHSDSTSLIQVYDFDTRMLRPDMYMGKYFKAMEGKADVFQWPVEDRVNPQASLLATQLKTANLRLTLSMGEKDSFTEDPPKEGTSPGRWKGAAAELSISPRPDLNKGKAIKDIPDPTLATRAPPAKVALPNGPRRRVSTSGSTSASFPDVSSEQHDIDELNNTSNIARVPHLSLEKLVFKKLRCKPLPAEATCFLCYEPGSSTNTIYATEMPTDLVFKLSGNEYPGPLNQLEIRIPVAVTSGNSPPRIIGRPHGLLMIPGTSTKPLLPVLEPLDSRHRWSYKCRLAQGHLYALTSEDSLTFGSNVSAQDLWCVMLVITITPRPISPLPTKMRMYNASFILRGVTFVRPEQDTSAEPRDVPSRTTHFDALHWDSSRTDDEVMSVRSTKITVRPATTVSILADETEYDLDTRKLSITYELSHLPPVTSNIRLTGMVGMYNGDESAVRVVKSVPLPTDPLENSAQGRYRFQSTYDMELGEVPLEIRLAAVSNNSEAIGPDSAPFVFPRLPSRVERQSHRFCWKDGYFNIYWTRPKAMQMPYTRTYDFSDSVHPPHSVEENADAGVLTIEKNVLVSRMSKENIVSFDLVIKVGKASPIKGTISTSRQKISLWPNPKGLPLSIQPSKIAAPPLDTSGVGVMRLWKGQDWIETEALYWSSQNTLGGIRYAYNAGWNPYTREGVFSITGVAGAGSLAPFQIKMTNRFKLVWIGVDGSVNMSSREGDFPEMWTTTTIAPGGSASVLGGGTLAVCGDSAVDTVEDEDHVPRDMYNPAFWWVGPRGEICGRRYVPGPAPGSEEWVDIGPGASLPAGSIDVSPSLTRPAQMATVWAYDSENSDDAYLIWVNLEGDLMVTRAAPTSGVHRERVSKTGMAYHNINAAPGTALAAHIDSYPEANADGRTLHVHWIGVDGSVFIGQSPTLWKAADGPQEWRHILTIASPGAASPLTPLCVVGGSM